MVDQDTVEEHLTQILALEEDSFLESFHQLVQKAREKVWHDRHIKKHSFKGGGLLLLYDNKFMKFPGNFHMHWLRSYIIKEITEGGCGEVKL